MSLARCVAISWLLTTACAGMARAESFTMGLEAGVDAATFSPADTGESIVMRPGAVAGFYAVIPILKSVSIVPELLYVQKFSRRTSGSTRTDLQIEYVELPLLAKMPFLWGTYFAEGASFAFPVEMHGLVPNLVQITSPDVAIVIGGGYDLSRKFAMEFRYESGLRRVSRNDGDLVQHTRAFMAIAKLHF